MARNNLLLNDCWEEPQRIAQLDLFGRGRDYMLALGGVSIEEVERWRAKGWISFDIRELHSLDTGISSELWFIRNIARSGLSDVQIDTFLGELEPPYMYDPIRTAYSFSHGWVQCPLVPSTADWDQYMEENLKPWLIRKVARFELDELRRIQQDVMAAIADAVAMGARSEESE